MRLKFNSAGWLASLVAVIVLGVFVTFARHGLIDLVTVTAQRDRLTAEKVSLDARNRRLAEQIARMRTRPEAHEAVARLELGLAKPNELIYIYDPVD